MKQFTETGRKTGRKTGKYLYQVFNEGELLAEWIATYDNPIEG